MSACESTSHARGPITESNVRSAPRVGDLDPAADLVHRELAQGGLVRDGLEVEPQLLAASPMITRMSARMRPFGLSSAA